MSSPFLSDQAKWVWVPDFDDTIDPGQFVLFRKTFHLEDVPKQECLLHVSADTRYRIFLNGKSISFGPCKSYPSRWYYETVDIVPLLLKGENVLSAKVLRFSSTSAGGTSMTRTALPGLIVFCKLDNVELHTNETWRSKRDESTQLVPASEWDYRLGPPFLNLSEKVDARKAELGWHEIDFDDSSWHSAAIRTMKTKMSPMLDARRLTPRSVPVLPEIPQRFDNAVTCEGMATLQQWRDFLESETPVHLAANSTTIVEVESTILTTGFLEFECTSTSIEPEDAPAKIKIICAESYEHDMDKGQARSKGNRTDSVHGKLYGPADTYTCHHGSNRYFPFWWRTFRYIRLEISAGTHPLIVNSLTYRSTHYPLEVTTHINSNLYINQLWTISLNTLKNCMHETYEDCPFYEQNQFAMDSRSSILFTYLVSRDDRLARKTIHEFYASRRDDGLLETHFPNPGRSVNIPQFSLFWILMVYDHMANFGDKGLVRRYIGTADDILNHFGNRVNALGLVGKFDDEAWPFIDWVDEWVNFKIGFKGMGVPKAYHDHGAATFNSLVYAMTLQHTAELCDVVGWESTATEYRHRAASLNSSVNLHCFDKEIGLYLDGPNAMGQYSQHVQVFAVLAGAISGSEAKSLMCKTIVQQSELKLAKASFAMSFYVFRAVSLVDIYEEVWETLLAPWRKMVNDGLTTWAESESMVRSDCHGWSSSPMYEVVREVLGVKLVRGMGYGSERIIVRPRVGLVKEMKGTVVVGGDATVEVGWDETGEVRVKFSKDMEVEVVVGGPSRIVKFDKGKELLFNRQ